MRRLIQLAKDAPSGLKTLGVYFGTVLVVDEHPIISEAIAHLVRPNPTVWAKTCLDAKESLEAEIFRIVIVDPEIEGGQGFSLLKEITSQSLSRNVLAFCSDGNRLKFEEAMQLGTLGFLSKAQGARMLLEAILAVAQGKRYVDPTLSMDLIAGLLGNGPDLSAGLTKIHQVTLRQLDLTPDISDAASHLQISENALKARCAALRKRLGLRDMIALLQFARDWCNSEQ